MQLKKNSNSKCNTIVSSLRTYGLVKTKLLDYERDAMLLDNIEGKYGDGSDYDDLNADEDALLADDAEFLTINHSQLYDDTAEELDHEPEEVDTEDVLDLEAQDVELEDDVEEKNLSHLSAPHNISDFDNSTDQKEREDKFKTERDIISSKAHDIPDSLDKVQVVASVPSIRHKRNTNKVKNWGRNGHHGNRNAQNQTVLINPHFKGHVKINNNARLAWDARQRITNKNNQVGRIAPFLNNRNTNQNVVTIQPWLNTNNRNDVRGSTPNVPPFQQQVPVYQPPPPQVPMWNQFQPPLNQFNQMPEQQMQMPMNNNQLVFMQPLPQNVFGNQQVQPQFNHPTPQFANYNASPMYSNPIQNHPFNNNQFLPPPNQFNQQVEPFTNYSVVQPNQYSNIPVTNNQYNQQTNTFVGNRTVRQKPNFPHSQKVNKRKVDLLEAKKKKRSLNSTNLHEVHTVELTPFVPKQEKLEVPEEEEDEETKEYRLKIEEQKRKREEIMRLKEERRLKAIQNGNADAVTNEPCQETKPPVRQKVFQKVRPTQPARFQQVVSLREQVRNSNVVINTNSDDSNYDKQHLASFLANRKILTKDQSLIDTSIVVMKNLSAGTTEIKLRKMCQGIGDIKKLQMSLKERQATIQFSSVASAHAFFKKYQRTMLDLSVIQVSLKPMS